MTQANNVATQCNRITALGVLKAAGGGTNVASPGTSGNVLTSTGTAWASLPVTGFLRATRYFTTPGIFTYTPNSGTSFIIVTCIGGGGGGGSSKGANGLDGSASYFGSFMTANGGHGGLVAGGSYITSSDSGIGGSASGGDLNITGGDGGSAISYPFTGSYPNYYSGGLGGSSAFGGAGQGGLDSHIGLPGKTNTGGGGGGGTNTLVSVADCQGGGGGGAGGYCVKTITSGFSGVSYQVGGGGTGGVPISGDKAGGNGGSGIVIVQEFS